MSKLVQTPSDIGKVRVLVYGTLKQNHTNHRLMRSCRAEFIGYDSVSGAFKLKNLGPFPAVFDLTKKEKKKLKGTNKIKGELYMMDEESLAHLDFYEGHPNFFERRKMWTDVLRKRAWMYFLTVPEFNEDKQDTEVINGIWKPSEDEKVFWGLREGA